jgi:hypothetical protein
MAAFGLDRPPPPPAVQNLGRHVPQIAVPRDVPTATHNPRPVATAIALPPPRVRGVSKGDIEKVVSPSVLHKGQIDRTRFFEEASRKTNAGFRDRVFKKQMGIAFDKGGDRPLRSVPASYWDVIGKLVDRGMGLGGPGRAMGDAHPSQFQFKRMPDGSTAFGYNDLDDAAVVKAGGIAFDAVHYFVSLRFEDPKMLKAAIERYVKVLDDPSAAVDPSFLAPPSWDKIAKQKLDRYTTNDHFDRSAFEAVKPTTFALVKGVAEANGYQVHDVVKVERDEGGSAGMKRYWVLADHVENGKTRRTILELKERGVAAASLAGSANDGTTDDGVRADEVAFFGPGAQGSDFGANMKGRWFQVRDRLGMAGIDPKTLSREDQEKLVLAQASKIAEYHRDAMKGVDRAELRTWLETTTETFSDLYAQLGKEEGK